MEHLIEFVRKIYRSSIDGKIYWESSPSLGGFYAKLGENRIEIVDPNVMSARSVIRSLTNNPIDPMTGQRMLNYRQAKMGDWKIVVYKADGRIDFEIGNSMFKDEAFHDIGLSPKEVFAKIYASAFNYDVKKEKETVSNILKYLKEDK